MAAIGISPYFCELSRIFFAAATPFSGQFVSPESADSNAILPAAASTELPRRQCGKWVAARGLGRGFVRRVHPRPSLLPGGYSAGWKGRM